MNAPQYPDPAQTANVQSGLNKDTAIAQSNLNAVNQKTPYGDLTYSTTGTNPDGTPIRTATQTLSPDQQQILDTNTGSLKSLSNTGTSLASQIGNNLSSPLDFSQQKDYLNNLTNQNLDYEFGRGQQSLEQSLANKGLKVGDESYNASQRNFDTGKAASYNAANLGNYTTALQSQQALRDLPANELSGLLSQTQIQQPSFAQTPTSGIQSPDYTSQVGNQYDAQNGQYNSFWNGVGSFGGSLLKLSDKTLKTDIGETGMKTPDGIPVKTWRYKGSPMMQMGVIAQDVEKKRPDAVGTIMGKKAVDYKKIGSPMLALGTKKVA